MKSTNATVLATRAILSLACSRNSWSGPVKANVWHDYAIEIRGDHIQVFWNGERVLEHHDGTFTERGRVGVWTNTDSIEAL